MKIADFGISKRHSESTKLHTTLSGGGDSDFAAPEMLGLTDDTTVTDRVDMWSVGCLVSWLLSQDLPIRGVRAMCRFADGIAPLSLDKISAATTTKDSFDFVSRL